MCNCLQYKSKNLCDITIRHYIILYFTIGQQFIVQTESQNETTTTSVLKQENNKPKTYKPHAVTQTRSRPTLQKIIQGMLNPNDPIDYQNRTAFGSSIIYCMDYIVF